MGSYFKDSYALRIFIADFFPECGVSNQENRIVGGIPTGINRYPWIARIIYDGHYHCGASLLTENYVITAAHCVRRYDRFLCCRYNTRFSI